MNKKLIIGIIIGLILGSISVYAGSKFYASDVSVDSPVWSNLGSNATIQNALDDLYSKINSYTKLYSNGTAIYYNPTTGEKCTSSSAVSTTGTKNGCMKWYTFNDSEGNTTVNLILDHNTTARIAYNSTGNNSEMNEVAKQLINDTKAWKNAARLITANEVAKISGNTSFDASKTGQSWFYFGSNNQSDTSKRSDYGWLYDRTRSDCETYGCLNNADQDTWGYWTSTANVGSSANAWLVIRDGFLTNYPVTYTGRGVRPVISVSKSIIK